ncbi:MAG: hypothetical protein B7Z60_07430 [Ferrovum sp. 37-45-19]|nr:MAG: hypothetical protein B7Z65_07620 [Ferrovum sp. 21-44-67]OYV93719.1 MAG: hypothetical protein B7Z60_07430 [Ferrovum sp. 37-45-19]OZB32252.1 MAG: hypothetical protein B7X47_06775 [Ferrovum sp. 34-44-207]HQT81325.1 VIT family protein [Ferrovaceae bacterium]HQU06213.1 VIT family protein [Ferrovaceae bacterium]
MSRHHSESHRTEHIGWLRAAVLGANDGIVSTASLIIGVASARADHSEVLLAAVAGLIAGAMSMAAGEYVSVSSQADIEEADVAREKIELEHNREHEVLELSGIYEERGLSQELARQVAIELMAKDALGAHLRDELGLSTMISAKPLQAALTSALSFTGGAILPLACAWILPVASLPFYVGITSLFFLVALGALAAYTGRANILKGILRVSFWGILAMVFTAVVGGLFHVAV